MHLTIFTVLRGAPYSGEEHCRWCLILQATSYANMHNISCFSGKLFIPFCKFAFIYVVENLGSLLFLLVTKRRKTTYLGNLAAKSSCVLDCHYCPSPQPKMQSKTAGQKNAHIFGVYRKCNLKSKLRI